MDHVQPFVAARGEVKVKIVVLKDADGPEGLEATTTLVATRTLVPTTTTYEMCTRRTS